MKLSANHPDGSSWNEVALLALVGEGAILMEEDGPVLPADLELDRDGVPKGYAAAVKKAAAQPRFATGLALLNALPEDKHDAPSVIDAASLSARSAVPIPQDDPAVLRIAKAAEMTPAAWFDAALAV